MAQYHEQHRDDLDEWEATAEIVMPQRTGMVVYSLRLPMAEVATLKADADARGVTASALVRRAIRNDLATSASGALSYGHVPHVRVTRASAEWRGGSAAPSQIRPPLTTPVFIGASRPPASPGR